MISFFQLIDDVVISVLSLWTDTISLARVDSAWCNIIDRTALLELISKPHFTTDNGTFSESDDKYMLWCTQWKLKLRSFKFNKTHCGVKLNLSCMSEIVIELSNSEIDMNWMGKLINSCHVLDKITVIGAHYFCSRFDNVLSQIKETILNQLIVIQLKYAKTKEDEISRSVVSHLSAHCRALGEISINRPEDGSIPDLAQLVLNNSKTLQRISIQFPLRTVGAESIILAAQQCRDLTELTLSGLQFVDTRILSETAKLVRVAPQLHTLRLEGIDVITDQLLMIYLRRLPENGETAFCTCGWSMQSGVTGLTWFELLNAVPLLHHIMFNACESCSNDFFLDVSAARPRLSSVTLFGANASAVCSLQTLREIFPQCLCLNVGSESWNVSMV